jgi:hypothetical protein
MSRDLANIVNGPVAQRGGKKIDTWKVCFPGKDACNAYGKQSCDIDVYMKRDEDSVYEFFLDLSPEKGHPFKAHLYAETPTELKDLLNVAAMKNILETWEKKLMVKFDKSSWRSVAPEDQGDHELSMEWRIVYCKNVGKRTVFVYKDELFTRHKNEGHERNDGWEMMPWTQQREDVLRSLGIAIQEANERLVKLVSEGKMTDALDGAASGVKLLTANRGADEST